MKFADVEGKRREAQPGLSGKCPLYGHAMIPKCGNIRVPHWAHLANCTCDHWWEPETPWHRDWKNHFPEAWQEIVHKSEDGEKHIADVKTESGMVFEFQRSFLRRDERALRERFYQNMVWVIDGLRRARDRKAFFASLKRSSIVIEKPLTFYSLSNECALLRDWVGSPKAVFFDFGDKSSEPGGPLSFPAAVLWRLKPGSPKREAYLSPVWKTSFLDSCIKGSPFKGMPCSVELARAFRGLWHKGSSHRRR